MTRMSAVISCQFLVFSQGTKNYKESGEWICFTTKWLLVRRCGFVRYGRNSSTYSGSPSNSNSAPLPVKETTSFLATLPVSATQMRLCGAEAQEFRCPRGSVQSECDHHLNPQETPKRHLSPRHRVCELSPSAPSHSQRHGAVHLRFGGYTPMRNGVALHPARMKQLRGSNRVSRWRDLA